MSLPQFNGQGDVSIKRVYYAGTATLNEGTPLTYDFSASATLDPTTDLKNARGVRVVDPATATLTAFAGLVTKSSAGVTGPAWVDIYKPVKGDVVKGHTSISCTAGTTTLGITNAGGTALVAHSDATFNHDMVAIALQTVDRSSTAGTVLLKFV